MLTFVYNNTEDYPETIEKDYISIDNLISYLLFTTMEECVSDSDKERIKYIGVYCQHKLIEVIKIDYNRLDILFNKVEEYLK